MCSNAYFVVFRGGGHFWRVTQNLLIVRVLGDLKVSHY